MKEATIGALIGVIAGFMMAVGTFDSVRRDYVKAGVFIVGTEAYRVGPLEPRP